MAVTYRERFSMSDSGDSMAALSSAFFFLPAFSSVFPNYLSSALSKGQEVSSFINQ